MNWSSLLTGGINKVVDSVGDAIDKLVTSDEEKLAMRNALVKIQVDADKEARKDANEFEKEITKRWLSDNEHFITRLVRPLIVVFLYALFGIIVLADGNIGKFSINATYIPVIQTLLVTITVAYFGSRGAEKITKSIKGK